MHRSFCARLLLGLAWAATGAAAGPLLYEFSYAPAGGEAIQPFTFGVIAPGPLSDSQSLTFAPYTVTDGTNSFLVTQGITAASGSDACVNFGTASTVFAGCGGTVSPPGGGFEGEFAGGIPSVPGAYSSTQLGGLFEMGATTDSMGGVLNLEVSAFTAPLLYRFTYTPGNGETIQPFTFEFISPPLSDSETLIFNPYTIVDGTTSVAITQGMTGPNGSDGCFNFGGTSTSLSGCGGSVGVPGAGYEATFTGGVPTVPGTFTSASLDGLFEGDTTDRFTGVLTVDVSVATPEPSTVLLWGLGIGVLAAGRKKGVRHLFRKGV